MGRLACSFTALFVLTISACSWATEQPATSDATGPTGSWTTCENDVVVISYPYDWFVHHSDAELSVQDCELFAAEPFQSEREPDWGWVGAQVVVRLEEGCRGSFERPLSEERLMIHGLTAWKRMLAPAEGEQSPLAYEYFVNLSPDEPCETGRWLYARTESDDPGDFEANQQVLDTMWRSLTFIDG